jgi:FtsP/CotA-like multicopper oxidase with cupredoxin domain
MRLSRRNFLQALLGGASALPATAWLTQADPAPWAAPPAVQHHTRPTGQSATPVVTPDVPDLSFTLDNGVKVFHLVAEPVQRELLPGRTVNLWGYNGTSPGPTIQAQQGDRLRIVFENHLPEPTAIHWHGLEIPPEMDGVPGITQPPVLPGERFVYEFTVHQAGTFFYHSHMAMQEMLGMIGAFILHPRTPFEPRVDRDFLLILQEYALLPNNPTPNTMSMEFNWLTLNGRAAPATTPLLVRLGERVRIRLINLGMDHHPIHLHGNTFYVTGTEAGRIPASAWRPENTVLVGVAQARDIEFEARYPGDWMLHCHLPHHMMNQMASMVGPMTRHPGMPAGVGMPESMGMARQGSALAEHYGPALGRGLGAAGELERQITNGPLGSSHQGHHGSMHHLPPGWIAAGASNVPGFPQDAYMNGPQMAMDDAVARPETRGLPPGWSGFLQGMMTLVRVLPPEEFDRIVHTGRPS